MTAGCVFLPEGNTRRRFTGLRSVRRIRVEVHAAPLGTQKQGSHTLRFVFVINYLNLTAALALLLSVLFCWYQLTSVILLGEAVTFDHRAQTLFLALKR